MSSVTDFLKRVRSEKKIGVIGAAVVDVIIQLDTLPKSGEDATAEHRDTIVGGCAYNVSNILKELQVTHDLIVPVGRGTYAGIVKNSLINDGYPLFIEDGDQDNGWNLSIVESTGERTFITIPGLEVHWKLEWFTHLPLPSYDYLYLSGYELEGPSGKVIMEALAHRKETATIIFDASPRIGFLDPETLDKMLQMGTILHLNRTELCTLTGLDDLQESLQKVYGITNQPVVVTLGKDGTIVYDATGDHILPAVEVKKLVDTIGAGDSHTGGLIAALAAGYPIGEACILANEIAGLVVQQQGGKLDLKQAGL